MLYHELRQQIRLLRDSNPYRTARQAGVLSFKLSNQLKNKRSPGIGLEPITYDLEGRRSTY